MKISLIGDIAFTGLLNSDSENNEKRFSEISAIVKQSNCVIANLEVPVKSGKETNENKKFVHFSTEDSTRQILKLLNIKCVSLANNHIYDFKIEGLKKTIKVLDDLNIKHTGAGWKQEHLNPVIIEQDGLKIGFMAYVDISTNPKTESFKELHINYFDIETVKRDILTVKPKVDFLILSVHWGNDYSYFPTQHQIYKAHQLVDYGIDIIMGHHPHTIQPYENYKNGTIYYSLGGLVFGDFIKNNKLISLPLKTKNGVIVNFNSFNSVFEHIITQELIGNFIKTTNKSFEKWSSKKWRWLNYSNKNKFIHWVLKNWDTKFFKIENYFFGYYHNPIKRIFEFKNIKKLKKLFSN